jgi:hypothetical protein
VIHDANFQSVAVGQNEQSNILTELIFTKRFLLYGHPDLRLKLKDGTLANDKNGSDKKTEAYPLRMKIGINRETTQESQHSHNQTQRL